MNRSMLAVPDRRFDGNRDGAGCRPGQHLRSAARPAGQIITGWITTPGGRRAVRCDQGERETAMIRSGGLFAGYQVNRNVAVGARLTGSASIRWTSTTRATGLISHRWRGQAPDGAGHHEDLSCLQPRHWISTVVSGGPMPGPRAHSTSGPAMAPAASPNPMRATNIMGARLCRGAGVEYAIDKGLGPPPRIPVHHPLGQDFPRRVRHRDGQRPSLLARSRHAILYRFGPLRRRAGGTAPPVLRNPCTALPRALVEKQFSLTWIAALFRVD